MSFIKTMMVYLMAGAVCLMPLTLSAQVSEEEQPVDLTADRLENDEANQIVTAIGNVELVQAGRILKADKVQYFLNTDTVRAEGNVVLNEVTGEVYFADEVELTDNMKDGFARGIRGLLTDGGRFSADEGQRIGGTKLVMEEATYTACEICESDPDKTLPWQLMASKVIHDEEDQRIVYENARLEMFGVPVIYTPYFSHPDGSVDQKSGFLTPSFGFDSTLGANYSQSYYWAIDQDKDATIGAMVASDVNPLLLGEYRQCFENAQITVAGGITYSDRVALAGGREVAEDDEVRGHFEAEGIWDINQKWRAGIDSEWASDDQYMRQYNISSDDVLENRIYAERFSGRNYARVQAIGFQDIRISERQEDQPAVFPELKASFIGEPNEMLGGRWSAGLSALSLVREGDDQDLGRLSSNLGWQRRFVSDSGLVAVMDANARGDVYYVSDRDIADLQTARSNTTEEARGFMQGNMEVSYPLVNNFETMQAVIEPVASVTVGSNVNVDNDVPNEDSEDTVVDAMNLFEPDRFTGLDRIEDRSRVTYGMRSGLYGNNGYNAEIFLGQSYRLDSDDNPFSEGSGLDGKESDYVGSVSASLGSYLDGNYRFQLDNQNFSSQRHEVDATSTIGPVTLSGLYFYGVGIEGTEVEETREQLIGSTTYKFDDEWYAFGGLRYDFGEDEGLRTASYGLGYEGQCWSLQATGQRTLTRESSGDSSTEIFLRLGLKNLGEFSTSGVTVSNDE